MNWQNSQIASHIQALQMHCECICADFKFDAICRDSLSLALYFYFRMRQFGRSFMKNSSGCFWVCGLLKVVNFIPLPKSNVTGSGTGTLGGVMSVLDCMMRGWSGTIY